MAAAEGVTRTWPGSKFVYYGHAGLILTLGAFLLAAPTNWFGPSWSYFPWLPHNGVGMGITCTALGLLQLLTIHRNCVGTTWVLLYMGGITNFTAGVLLAAEGIFGHQGLMEAPWMCTVGVIKWIQCFVLRDDYRRRQQDSDAT